MKILKELFADSNYLKKLITVALPISAQFFVSSALNMVDVMMVGQSGEVPVASVGLANQIYFLMSVFIFGISAGTSIFCAQFWGKKDIINIQKTMGLGLTINTTVALLFTSAAFFVPKLLISMYSKDSAVIELGSKYLRIVSISYLFTSFTMTFSTTLRSTEHLILPTSSSIFAIMLNTTLNYLLIFGKFGFPELGVEGAAYATLISRFLECTIIILITYIKRYPAALSLHNAFAYSFDFVKKYLNIVLPSLFTEASWALGVTIYMSIYAKTSTESVAAINIASTIEMLSFVMFIGIAHGSGILIGKSIGENNDRMLKLLTWRSVILVILLAIFMGGLLIAISGIITDFYHIEESTTFFLRNILIILGCFFWIKTGNMLFVDGILRNGGDTKFSFFLNFLPIYLIGIPCGLLGAFIFHLPVHFVYLLINIEEIVRFSVGFMRVRSGKWVNNLVADEALG